MECEALGLMGVRECYIMDKGNSSVMSWVRTQRGQRGLDANEQYWEANLKGTEATSIEKCKGRGVWAPAKPPQGAAGAGARRSCLCYAGFGGPSCERSTLARERRNCLNGCSGRGACVRNWCHCDAGFYGVDCSLGEPAPGQTAAPLPPLIGAQTGRHSKGAPRVYVYELPPEFNAWMQAGAGGWWQVPPPPPPAPRPLHPPRYCPSPCTLAPHPRPAPSPLPPHPRRSSTCGARTWSSTSASSAPSTARATPTWLGLGLGLANPKPKPKPKPKPNQVQ